MQVTENLLNEFERWLKKFLIQKSDVHIKTIVYLMKRTIRELQIYKCNNYILQKAMKKIENFKQSKKDNHSKGRKY